MLPHWQYVIYNTERPLEDSSSSLHLQTLIWIHDRKRGKRTVLQFHCIWAKCDNLENIVTFVGKKADYLYLRINIWIHLSVRRASFSSSGGPLDVVLFGFFIRSKSTQSHTVKLKPSQKNVRNFVYFIPRELKGNTSHSS